MIRLHSHQVAGVVLHDGHLAGCGPEPAADLQDGVRRLDGSPDSLVSEMLDITVGGEKVLCEEVTLLVRRDTSCWSLW